MSNPMDLICHDLKCPRCDGENFSHRSGTYYCLNCNAQYDKDKIRSCELCGEQYVLTKNGCLCACSFCTDYYLYND